MSSPAAPVWWGHVHNCTLEAAQPFPALSSTSQDDTTDNHPKMYRTGVKQGL